MEAVERAITELEPSSLEQLDEQAKLHRRVDSKYVVPGDLAADVVRSLATGYCAREIDGRRRFTYESVYFDTPELRCFTDQVGREAAPGSPGQGQDPERRGPQGRAHALE